jgi:hypothetical protein
VVLSLITSFRRALYKRQACMEAVAMAAEAAVCGTGPDTREVPRSNRTFLKVSARSMYSLFRGGAHGTCVHVDSTCSSVPPSRRTPPSVRDPPSNIICHDTLKIAAIHYCTAVYPMHHLHIQVLTLFQALVAVGQTDSATRLLDGVMGSRMGSGSSSGSSSGSGSGSGRANGTKTWVA